MKNKPKFQLKAKAVLAFFVCLFCLLVLSFGYYAIVVKSVNSFNGITIVLDAGHGGRDGGSVGKNGTIEKEINLEYTLALKSKLTSNGYRVELTRKTDDGLYSPTAKNKKLSDMNKRFQIIERANPNLVISIHMNSFNDSSVRGAYTYYRKGDSAGHACANLIQKSLNTYCNAKQTAGKIGDYFILNCSYYTAVLIECGFISNPEEEVLLNSCDYKNKFVDAVFKGILLYFGSTSNEV